MSISNTFKEFCQSIKLVDKDTWISRFKRITKKINEKYYDNPDDDVNHRLRVGSTGRYTATNDASDYDVLYHLPWSTYDKFDSHEHGQSDLLQEVKNCIKDTYSKTDISADGQVVDVNFHDGLIEIVPGFENCDKSFQYPDTHKGGSWKKTNPRPEKDQCSSDDNISTGTFRDLARMIRVWKNHKGFVFQGILIDTLVHNFYKENEDEVNNYSYSNYPQLMYDLFQYLSEQDSEQIIWHALGSNQEIKCKDNHFIKKAKDAVNDLDEIDLNNEDEVLDAFKSLFGYRFSRVANNSNASSNEEFASAFFRSIDIRGTFDIKCVVKRKGFMNHGIAFFKHNFSALFKSSQLVFSIENEDFPEKYEKSKITYYWKVRNYGTEARAAECLRGRIIKGERIHTETTKYTNMYHYVECYAVVDNIVIARAKVVVPIGDK
ncbi:SMODS domain-containing nucleotidyltransferase [Limosilactobacillus frumenti]|uniref:SMODS domain-containing nucleotidyltransferase n=1 Tax=Limosilactobacillus frumenti TaxID=104955 RepID=UPI0015EB9446|nr:nucleotidyltransferase [Limosilactobacillus frumenti]MBA2913643.1 nucleotidyltransferase [Limosilactobacillus frumenti]